jgi:hypothetical protein
MLIYIYMFGWWVGGVLSKSKVSRHCVVMVFLVHCCV